MSWRLFLLHSLLILLLVSGVGTYLVGAEHFPRMALIGLIAAISAWLPAWYVRRYYLKPLADLTYQADRLAEGQLGDKIYAGSGGEVRNLNLAFNVMSEQLADRFEQLQDDRRRLRGILDGMVEGVVALDETEQIVFANDRAGTLLDFDGGRVVGKKFWEVVRQRPVQDVVAAANRDRQPRRAELEWQAATARSLALYAAPLGRTSDAGLIVVVHDVSDLRRLEKVRQEFVANVSHELKTPIAVIKACVETLLDGAADDREHRGNFLDQIDEQADRLHALILDLLNLARLEAGPEWLDPKAIKIDEVVAAAVERHRPRAEANDVRLNIIAPTEMAQSATADEDALASILDNLLDNAIKYTPAGGRIEVRWGGDVTCAWMEVADTGVGIPEADLPRIFERFYRVDKARSRELGGTGLGLAIVKHITQAMNGSVSVRSKLGLGSTFRVRLPIAEAG